MKKMGKMRGLEKPRMGMKKVQLKLKKPSMGGEIANAANRSLEAKVGWDGAPQIIKKAFNFNKKVSPANKKMLGMSDNED